MDDAIENIDENGNVYLQYILPPRTPEQQAIVDAYENDDYVKPISPSFYEATSPSMDYVHNATNIIRNLLDERRTEVNDGDYEMVLVWDLGEITAVTMQHIIHLFSFHRDIYAHSLMFISNRILENTKFSSKYDWLNVFNIEDVDEDESEEMKERASSYYALEKFYNEISDGMREDGPIINYELIEKCGLVDKVLRLYSGAVQMQRLFHQRWKTARKCLELVNKQSEKSHRKYTNVVLSKDGIGEGSMQLLACGSSKQIEFDQIYSLRKPPKKMALERIQKRYGEKCVLVSLRNPIRLQFLKSYKFQFGRSKRMIQLNIYTMLYKMFCSDKKLNINIVVQ